MRPVFAKNLTLCYWVVRTLYSLCSAMSSLINKSFIVTKIFQCPNAHSTADICEPSRTFPFPTSSPYSVMLQFISRYNII